jgi:signal transduction histidine kinase
MGDYSEIYKKCKYLLNYNSIQYIEIIDSNSQVICNMGTNNSKDYFKVEDKIYFDDSKNNLAANILILYKDNTLPIIYKKTSTAIFVTLLIFLVSQLVLMKLLKKKYVLPIEKIANILEFNQIKSIKELNFTESVTDIYEIDIVQLGLKNLFKKLEVYEEDLVKKTSSEVKYKLARQLSHDIRSPLAALKVVRDIGGNNLEPDQAKLLTMSIERITDIANTILPKNDAVINPGSSDRENCFLWALIDQIVSEKRVQYRGLKDVAIDANFDSSPFSINAVCNPIDFMRAISNILNNSVEAKIENRSLNIRLIIKAINETVRITIEDNGKGIPAKYLSKIFDDGFTSGKADGSGLGLFQVKQSIELWGGKIDLQSVPDVGTTIIIELKKSQRPKWLVDEIYIHDFEQIFVLDDEEYVFEIIRDKFREFEKPVQYFKLISDFSGELEKLKNGRFLCFVDHDLKQDVKGLDLIVKLKLQKNAILLTGNYDDREVQQRSLKASIKILPKPLIHDLPIET